MCTEPWLTILCCHVSLNSNKSSIGRNITSITVAQTNPCFPVIRSFMAQIRINLQMWGNQSLFDTFSEPWVLLARGTSIFAEATIATIRITLQMWWNQSLFDTSSEPWVLMTRRTSIFVEIRSPSVALCYLVIEFLPGVLFILYDQSQGCEEDADTKSVRGGAAWWWGRIHGEAAPVTVHARWLPSSEQSITRKRMNSFDYILG